MATVTREGARNRPCSGRGAGRWGIRDPRRLRAPARPRPRPLLGSPEGLPPGASGLQGGSPPPDPAKAANKKPGRSPGFFNVVEAVGSPRPELRAARAGFGSLPAPSPARYGQARGPARSTLAPYGFDPRRTDTLPEPIRTRRFNVVEAVGSPRPERRTARAGFGSLPAPLPARYGQARGAASRRVRLAGSIPAARSSQGSKQKTRAEPGHL